MKKVFLLLLLISGVIHAQTTAIPDANFEQALIDLGIDSDATVNGSVLTSDINTLTSLDVSGRNITNLTGIEDFITLTYLNCWNNTISSLNVSTLTALDELHASTNSITSLDVSSNTVLTILHCAGNNLSSIDVSTNTSLTEVLCNSNSLTSLNLKNGQNSILTSVNTTNNSGLSVIQVDDATAANAGTGVYAGWTKDATATYSESGTLNLDLYDLNSKISLYPNPTKNDFSIVTNDISVKSVLIYNVLGKLMKKSTEKSYTISNFPPGMYLVKINTDKGNISKRIVVYK